jgi:hypothetical protein
VCGNDAYEVLSSVKEFLVIKKEQAELVLSTRELIGTSGIPCTPEVREKRSEIHGRLALLNRKGVA